MALGDIVGLTIKCGGGYKQFVPVKLVSEAGTRHGNPAFYAVDKFGGRYIVGFKDSKVVQY